MYESWKLHCSYVREYPNSSEMHTKITRGEKHDVCKLLSNDSIKNIHMYFFYMPYNIANNEANGRNDYVCDWVKNIVCFLCGFSNFFLNINLKLISKYRTEKSRKK